MRINELRKQRNEVVTSLETISKNAETEKRELDATEAKTFDELFDKSEDLKASIAREEKREVLQREIAANAADASRGANDNADDAETRSKKQMKGFRSWISRGETTPEFRALQADSDSAGGYLVTPEQFVNQLIKAVDDIVAMRTISNVMSVPNADSLGVPSLDNDPSDADWTAEIATGNEDNTMSFGKREFKPHPVAKLIKVSKTLLRKSPMNVENIVIDRLAYKFGITEEKAFLTGNGSNQPLGIFTASSNGISTGRDFSTGNTTTSIQPDGLIEAEMSLKDQYRKNARWLFHRDALKQIRKLKDGESRYLLDLRGGTINGIPYISSEYAPNTFTTGQYAGIIGDFQFYWIADALNMDMQRLNELYAATNRVGFIGRKETDGMPVLEEAFARVTLA